MAEQVPMPASMSRRLDNNNSARVKRIQNDGRKIENASGGTYNERNTNTKLAQGAPTDVAKPSMTAPAANLLQMVLVLTHQVMVLMLSMHVSILLTQDMFLLLQCIK